MTLDEYYKKGFWERPVRDWWTVEPQEIDFNHYWIAKEDCSAYVFFIELEKRLSDRNKLSHEVNDTIDNFKQRYLDAANDIERIVIEMGKEKYGELPDDEILNKMKSEYVLQGLGGLYGY